MSTCDKSQQREAIIKFFTSVCNNKLNKNCYLINFYKNRNAEHIFNWLQTFFGVDSPLHQKSLAQKYYHIFHNISEIPVDKVQQECVFVNFAIGYQGVFLNNGKFYPQSQREVISRKTVQFTPQPITQYANCKALFLEGVCNRTKSFLRNQATILNKVSANVINSALFYTEYPKTLPINFFELAYLLKTDTTIRDHACPYCSKTKKFARLAGEYNVTCGSINCKSEHFKQITKFGKVDIGTQTAEAKKKRVASRSWYKPSDETKEKISLSNKCTWTPALRQALVQQNRINGVYVRQGEKLKQKILSGEFTPCITNTWTHHDIKLPSFNRSYRSSWDAVFQLLNPTALYENLRVSYRTDENKTRVYIVDFYDKQTKNVYEIKPLSRVTEPLLAEKTQAIQQWCRQNGCSFSVVTEEYFKQHKNSIVNILPKFSVDMQTNIRKAFL